MTFLVNLMEKSSESSQSNFSVYFTWPTQIIPLQFGMSIEYNNLESVSKFVQFVSPWKSHFM